MTEYLFKFRVTLHPDITGSSGCEYSVLADLSLFQSLSPVNIASNVVGRVKAGVCRTFGCDPFNMAPMRIELIGASKLLPEVP